MAHDYTRKSAKNAIVGLVTQLLTNILGFVSRYVFIRCLSAEYLGINGLFANVLTLLSFAELGIGEALVYAMYKPMKDGDEEKLKSLLKFYKFAYRWIAGIVVVVGLILSFYIDGFVAQKPEIPENFQLIFCLYLFNNAGSYLLAYKQSVLNVDQNKYIVSTIRQIVSVGQLCCQMIFLYLTHNYYVYLAWQIAGTFINNLVLARYVDKHYRWAAEKKHIRDLDKAECNNIFKDIKALSISKVAGVVSNGADNIIIAKLISLTQVGLASNYTMVINSINGMLWGMLSSITGSIGQFNVDSDIEKKRKIFDELYLCTYWIYSCLCICLMALLTPLVIVWLGDRYVMQQYVVIALVMIIYVSGLNFPFYSFRVTCGMFEEMKYNYVYFAILNVVLSIVLGKWLGLVGVYAATVVSRLIAAEIKEGLIVYRMILKRSAVQYFSRYIFFALLLIVTYVLATRVVASIVIGGWIGLFIKGIVCMILINLVYLAVFFQTKEFRALLQKGKSLLHHK